MPLNKSSSKRKSKNLFGQNNGQGSPAYYLDGQVLHHHYDNPINADFGIKLHGTTNGGGTNNSMMNKTGSMAGDGDAIAESSVGKLTIPRFVGPLQSQRMPRNPNPNQDVTSGWLTSGSILGGKVVNITMESMS
jgi:hypothetical protein